MVSVEIHHKVKRYNYENKQNNPKIHEKGVVVYKYCIYNNNYNNIIVN